MTWIEEEFDIATGAQRLRNYQGVFTVTMIEQKDEARLLVNPLGLYISDLNFSEEMNKKSQTAGGK